MKSRIFIIIFLILAHFTSLAQIGGDDFDPSNPSDPGTPNLKYTLTLIAVPSQGGSVNSPSGKITAGESYNVYAYPNTDWRFVAWLSEDGDTLSYSSSFNINMPSKNTVMTAIFAYSPSNPTDPTEQPLKKNLSLSAQPANAGSFNFSSENVAVGSSRDLHAYTQTDFVFKFWSINDTVISTSQSFNYVMPDHNVKIVGHFAYNPSNPSNPGANYFNAQTGEAVIDDFSAGYLNSTLSNLLNNQGSSRDDVTMITVAGVMNSNDFGIANYYTNCTLLDISRVTGISDIPSWAFDYTNLESVYLPASIESIGYGAFYGCSQLTSLTCYAMQPPALSNNVFEGVPDGLVVYVPAAALALYQNADIWKDFTLLTIQEDINSLTVSLPQNINVSDYAHMWLEITNKKSGQKMHYVMSDKSQYTFNNIIDNTSWEVVVKNQTGDVFGKIETVDIQSNDTSVAFTSLSKPYDVNLKVLLPDGTDVTQQTAITWTDGFNNYILQGSGLTSQPEGKELKYRIVLPQDLALMYQTPQVMQYTVNSESNDTAYTLQGIASVKISGKVKDELTGAALQNAVVSASQTFAGKYAKTLTAKTDAQGNYSMEINAVPTSLAFAASDYVSKTLVIDSLIEDGADSIALDDIALKPVSGAVISLNFTYKSSTEEGKTAEVLNWYSDYNNISYSIFNKTKNKAVNDFNVQYPQIVLLEDVNEGDVLRFRITSKNSSFTQIETLATIDSALKATVNIDVVELGKINAEIADNDNENTVGSLYDKNGKLVKTYNYSNNSLTISNLQDGEYTLVTMGSSKFFNTIYDIEQLSVSGLTENSDYVKNTVNVESGLISVVNISSVPTLDESKLYYTGSGTSFTVNKPSIVAGNYLTLTGKVDFKQEFATKVSNVQLVIDMPENSSFVDNSVMVGNGLGSYSVDENRITIPLLYYTDRVRFCVIPTLGGEYSPSAFVQFDLDGQTITQPIGSAQFTAKDLSISAPSIVAKTSVPISGTAMGVSQIEIYDNGVLIGQTKSLANGTWTTTCELNDPYNLSKHSIYAKVTTKQGLQLQTETVECTYDKNAIQVQTVTMINYAHRGSHDADEVTVFDFVNGTTTHDYYYYPIYPDFTFIIDFTNNDTAIVSNVVLNVFTDDNKVVKLKPHYDAKQDRWVVKTQFHTESLPMNVSVDFIANTELELDTFKVFEAINNYEEMIADLNNPTIDSLLEDIDTELSSNDINFDLIDQHLDSLENIIDYRPSSNIELDSIDRLYIDSLTNAQSTEEFIRIITNVKKRHKVDERLITDGGYTNQPPTGPIPTPETPDNPKANIPKIDYYRGTDSPTEGNVSKKWEIEDIPNNENTSKITLLDRSSGDKIVVDFENTLPDMGNTQESYNNWLNSLGEMIDTYGENFSNSLALLEIGLDGCIDNLHIQQQLFDEVYGRTKTLPNQEEALKIMRQEYRENIKHIRDAYATKKALNMLGNGLSRFFAGFTTYQDINRHYSEYDKWEALLGDAYYLCNADAAQKLDSLISGYQEENRKRTKRSGLLNGGIAIAGAAAAGLSGMTMGTSLAVLGATAIASWGVGKKIEKDAKDNERNYRQVLERFDMYAELGDCRPRPSQDDPTPPTNPPTTKILDPSGYVYEGVPSNRLEGVTATCYYKDYVEDMYGDLNETVVIWDAENYAQENPLFTDENGMYRWDVPQGLWQVKFEKDGYQTTYSEWLPVPPPQLEVNIGMTQASLPEVLSAHAYEDAVEAEFDKYMIPSTLNTENITVMQNGEYVSGSIEFLNEEYAYGDTTQTFVSKVRFNADGEFSANEITLIINNKVKSYADISMQNDFMQTFTIEHELKSINVDSSTTVYYGNNKVINVSVLPAVASSGKTLNIKPSSQMIIGVDKQSTEIDSLGNAQVTVSGELPGTATLNFSVDGYDITAITVINVEQKTEEPAEPAIETTIDTVVCGQFVYSDSVYTASVTITDTLQSANNNDSIVTIHLTVNPVYDVTVYDTIAVNEKGKDYSDTVINNLLTITGCDSTVTTYTFYDYDNSVDTVFGQIAASICESQSYEFANKVLTASGTYYDTVKVNDYKDSITVLTLTVNPEYNQTVTASVCEGGSYQFGTRVLDKEGTYTDSLQTINGCDSVITLVLKVTSQYEVPVSANICEGSSYEFAGKELTVSGTYYDTLQSSIECDSIVILTLTVNPVYDVTVYDTVAVNEKGKDYSDTVINNLLTITGCDSTVTVYTFYDYDNSVDTVFGQIAASICESQSYEFANKVLTVSGTYYDTVNVNDYKDSITVLTLTVNPEYNQTLTASVCEGGSYQFGTRILDKEGTYTDSLQTINGCDSVITLQLSVTSQYEVPVSANICEGFSYEFAGKELTVSGTYYDTLQSSIECDSIVILTLTVNPVYDLTVYDTVTVNEKGKDYSDTVINNLQSITGCDSTVTTYTFYDYDNSVDTVFNYLTADICDNGTYLFAGKELTEQGTYTDTVHIDSYTDSITVLTLEVHPTYNITVSDTVLIETESGEDYTDTTIDSLQTINGCDSIVTTTTYYKYANALSEIDGNNAITVYPNPAYENVTVTIGNTAVLRDNTVTLTNSAGQTVYQMQIPSRRFTVNVKKFETGVYYINVGGTTKKLLIK
ncbi:MAG: leucine-rich repeat protein [Bacteroidales bacterium]|nr:leucine-rich repeat protein [Bacteroidales bacterium]